MMGQRFRMFATIVARLRLVPMRTTLPVKLNEHISTVFAAGHSRRIELFGNSE